MLSWLPNWLDLKARPPPRRSRPARRSRSRRLAVEELECRLTPSTAGSLPLNLPITSDSDVQQMPSIAVDPLDSQHLVVSYMDRSLVQTGLAGIGVAVSRDGGDTWTRTAVPLPAGFDEGAANPITRFDDQGRVFVSFMAADFLGPTPSISNPSIFNPDLGVRERTLGFQANNSIFVARSDNGGLSWAEPVAIDAHLYDGTNRVPFDIIPDLAIDTFATLPDGRPNPNHGSLYAVWARYYPTGQYPGERDSLGGSNIMVAVSRDGGQSWEVQLEEPPKGEGEDSITVIFNEGAFTGRLFPEGLGLENWAHVTVGPDGDVYVSQFLGGTFAVHHSFDGGQSFAHADLESGALVPFSVNVPAGPGPQLSNNQFRTQASRAIVADPTRPGHVYVAEENVILDPQGNVSDDGDVIFSRSTDYGVTWQTTFQIGARRSNAINDDNDGRSPTGRPDDVAASQALPCLVADAQGNLALIWYDTRRDPADHLLDVFGAVSTDGGLTFSTNFRVTDQSFDADAGQFIDATGKTNFYLGDFLGLALGGQTAYAVWADTRAGNQDVYFASFPVNPAPAPANDRFEPNDTPAAATDLSRVIARDLFKLGITAGDEDWFQVRTAATGSLTVTATLAAPGDLVRLELFDPSGTTRLATGVAVLDASGQVTGQGLTFPTSSGQTYLVRVLPGPGAASTPVRYTLGVRSLTADLGTLVHSVQAGSLSAGDEVFYALAAAAPGSLEVTLAPGVNAQGNWRLEFLDPVTLDVLATGSPAGAALHASLTVTKGQAVFVHVVGDAGAQGEFTLAFTNLDQFTTPDNRVLFFPTGDGASAAALADLNGDGRADVVVSRVGQATISVLLNNGDGTFQAPRDFAVGAFQQGGPFTLFGVQNYQRRLAVADFNRDGIADVVVVNTSSSDVSVLLGRGDGTFEPQRRYNATAAPLSLDAGDLNHDGILDLVVIDSTSSPTAQGGVLLGRGDGSFELPQFFTLENREENRTNSILLADLDDDGKLDLVERDFFSGTSVLLGNGDGTFRPETNIQPHNGPALGVGDLDGDGNLDILSSTFNTGEILYNLGNGEGTFQEIQSAFSGQFPIAVAVADLATVLPDGSILSGTPDGHPDVIVANNGRTLPTFSGPPSVVVLPGLVDDKGRFAGLGDPVLLATPKGPLDVKVDDVNGDGILDVIAVDRDGILVIFGKQPVISPNDTPQTARNLGSVVRLVEPTQTIVPGRTDAYYTLRVPTEAARGAGDEVLDFSGLFQATEGAGISMEVHDAADMLLSSGERFRVRVRQGQFLTLHVFGLPGPGGQRGAGAFTLNIDVLPQLVSVESQPLLPGKGQAPGGPTASLVLTFQGDRLDPLTAEDPANYLVTWLGPDKLAGTPDDRVIAIQSGSGTRSVVYDPSTNVNVASGNVYPTAIRQTVTMLFGEPLLAGSYRIELSAAIQTALFNAEEKALIADRPGLTGHPVVSLNGSQAIEGSLRTVPGLVFAAGALGDLDVFQVGTPFLTQLHDDLGAVLDAELSQRGDHPSIPSTIDNQILDRFDPALGPTGQRPVAVLVIWLDPVSPSLDDARGARIVFNQQDNSFVNTFSRAYVNVTGNLEVIVVPFFATARETFRLVVADVPLTARGGVIYFGAKGNEVRPLTAELRGGTTEFLLSYGSTRLQPSGATPASALQDSLRSKGSLNASGSTQASMTLVEARAASASVTSVGPLFQVPPLTVSSGEGAATTLASVRNGSSDPANRNASTDSPPETLVPSIRQLLSLFSEVKIALQKMGSEIRAWIKVISLPPAVEADRPLPERPGTMEMPMPPLEEAEPLPETQEIRTTQPGVPPPESDSSPSTILCVVGLSVCMVGLSWTQPNHRGRLLARKETRDA